MNKHFLKSFLTIFIVLVWLLNGLFFKILNFIPRHQLIVARIFSEDYSLLLTKVIGVLELLLAIWILFGAKSRLTACFQIVVVIAMNIIEITLAPDLLLFGMANIFFAFGFVAIIFYNEFILDTKRIRYTIT